MKFWILRVAFTENAGKEIFHTHTRAHTQGTYSESHYYMR